MLGFGSVFFEKNSLLTTVTLTECEILYIGRNEFYHILKRYPKEWSHIEHCTNRFKTAFYDLVKVNMDKYSHHAQQGRKESEYVEAHITKKITRKLNAAEVVQKTTETTMPIEPPYKKPKRKWNNPESKLMKYWMPIRAVSVVLFIVLTSVQGGCGAHYRGIIKPFTLSCYVLSYIDMILKCFMGYYDDRGIVIYSPLKCTLNYLSHGFILDVIAVFPWFRYIQNVPKVKLDHDWELLINAICKFARVHLLLGYFNYLADNPMVHVAIIVIIKWQVTLLLLMLIVSHYLILTCAKFEWDDAYSVNVTRRDTCWLPPYVQFDQYPNTHQQHLLFGESFSLTQSAFMRIFMGMFRINRKDFTLGAVLFSLGIVYWCVCCYSLVYLTLSLRGSTLFQHAVTSLSKFLHAERLEDELIQRSLAHFSYWWKRTKGIAIENLRSKTLSVIFSQDLNYFFFKQTLGTGLDSLLKGGEQIQRELACTGVQFYYLPGWTIMREQDLNPWVYVVHRGKVVITQDGKTLAYLTKGSIFGQIDGVGHRPVRVSAHTVDHVDILQIPAKAFQDNIDDEVRANIRNNPQSQQDYMQVKKSFKENPYNTVRYLLRGNKIIQLPWMQEPVEAHSNAWYNRWLALVWVIEPLCSAAIVLMLNTLPLDLLHEMLWVLLILDLIHLAYLVSEFYAVVDMVYLRFRDWQDLLEGYPDIKRDLYTAAKQLKSDLGKV
ncbi:hypothetical protein MSG28_010114 [Choristoneura fumiferana]|uniref:Uncharacterized protein n=1 Tax=Choristoneura fumiferana TaxID=7141 RepID=A0ACC0KK58_CHOFU|nr:hypothetical protein MSG28_010114 [Choristoneura fumiferana]